MVKFLIFTFLSFIKCTLLLVIIIIISNYIFQVSSNGYLAMGRIIGYSEIGDIPTPGISIVAPFAANTDLTRTGSVRWKTFFSHNAGTTFISAYISSRLGVSFNGTWMLIVYWYDVPQYLGSTVRAKKYFSIIIMTL